MNREDIIRMARETGLYDCIVFGRIESKDTVIERFAALVAAAEHKRVQQVYTDAATGSVKAAIAYEREACAKVCDRKAETMAITGKPCDPDDLAAAIRARGQA